MSDSLLHRLAARLFGREAHVAGALLADLATPPEGGPEPRVSNEPAFEHVDSNATERAWFRPEVLPLGRDPVDSSPDTSRWWRRPRIAAVAARPEDDGSGPDAA